MSRPYDSADPRWRIKSVPIYYFSGTEDAATPFKMAEYHYAHQTETKRTFVVIPGGLHESLKGLLPQSMAGVFSAITAEVSGATGDALSSVVGGCELPAITIKRSY